MHVQDTKTTLQSSQGGQASTCWPDRAGIKGTVQPGTHSKLLITNFTAVTVEHNDL